MEAERTPVADGAAEDSTEHVTPICVARLNAIGNGEAQSPDVVGDDAESDIEFFLLRVASASGFRQGGAVPFATEFFDGVENRPKNIRFVV